MSAERTAEEWGRVAVSLPGFRAMRGVHWAGENGVPMGPDWDPWPDPDDPATAGCFLSLLTSKTTSPSVHMGIDGARVEVWEDIGEEYPDEAAVGDGPTLGRACIAAAEALGRWPGGAA